LLMWAVVMDDASGQRCSDNYNRILSSGTVYRADSRHIAF